MWGWGRPKRDIPQVNYTESDEDEEDFESGLTFRSPLQSPRRPVPTREGSPLNTVGGGPTLADNVDDDLEEIAYKLHDIASVEEDIEDLTDLLGSTNTKVVGETSDNPDLSVDPLGVGAVIEETGVVLGQPQPVDCEIPPNRDALNDSANMVVDFDQANTDNGDKAQDLARSVKVEFAASDIRFWFGELEAEMLMANIGKQWLKKTVLQRNLPTKQKEDVKALLTLTETQAGEDIYYRIKQELIRIYAPKPKDSYVKALSRTMVGLPSQLGNQLVDDICKKAVKLDGCCCSSAVLALWLLQLPVNIRAHVSNMSFDHNSFKTVFEAADQVFLASKQVSVAAVSVAAQSLDETLPAFNAQNQPVEVAATSTRGRGGRGQNRGGARSGTGRGGGQSRGGRNKGQGKPQRGPRHSSGPPEACCDRHYVHGDQAWYCLAPLTCPWVSKCSARP